MTYRFNSGGGGASGAFAGNFDTIIDPPPQTASTPNDEFATAGLDPKWNVVNGAANPVQLPVSGVRLANYEQNGNGMLHFQCAGPTAADRILLRQDYELPNGRCIVAKLLYGDNVTWGFAGGDYNIVGMTLNDNDTDQTSGNRLTLRNRMTDKNVDFESGALGFIDVRGMASQSIPAGSDYIVGDHIYFRILRGAGNRYVGQVSRSGLAWVTMADVVSPTPLNNIWLHQDFVADPLVFPDAIPFVSWDWVREGSNEPFPRF